MDNNKVGVNSELINTQFVSYELVHPGAFMRTPNTQDVIGNQGNN